MIRRILKTMAKLSPKKTMAAVAGLFIAVTVALPAMAAFGPDRPTKAWSPNVEGFNYVTFNSFTGVGNGIGDERDFFRGVQVGRDSAWADPVKDVTQGAEVEGKIYIHNGADARLNDQPGNPGVAKNVTVKVDLPEGSKQSQDATAYISADNAQPKTVFDSLSMTGANKGFFEIEYVAGSAKLHNQDGSSSALSDSLVTTGVNIGDQKGCFEFTKEITFRMKVKMPRFTVTKQVALPGQTNQDWKESVDVKRGDTVSWLVTFKNAGKTELKHVKIVDEVPAGLTVVPGTVKLTNGNYPNGYVYPDTAIQANGRQVNVDVGNYNPDGIAYVSFRTTVDKEQGDAACVKKTVVNKAFATPEGFGSVNDTAQANVAAEQCVKPGVTTKELPKTGAGDVVGIFAATTIAGALAHRLFWARRTVRQ